MEKKQRTDAKKNKAKVIKTILKDPLKTQREIAKETGLGKTTVQEHLKTLDKAGKDDRIIGLTDSDFEIVLLAQGIIKDKLQNPKEVKGMRITDVSSVARDSAARYTIFRGKATDELGAINVESMSGDELLALIRGDK